MAKHQPVYVWIPFALASQTCGAHDGARAASLIRTTTLLSLSSSRVFSSARAGAPPSCWAATASAREGMALPLARGYALEHTTDWDAGKQLQVKAPGRLPLAKRWSWPLPAADAAASPTSPKQARKGGRTHRHLSSRLSSSRNHAPAARTSVAAWGRTNV